MILYRSIRAIPYLFLAGAVSAFIAVFIGAPLLGSALGGAGLLAVFIGLDIWRGRSWDLALSDKTRQTTLYIATNSNGDATADADRQTAINRLERDYGGEKTTVSVLSVTTPRAADYLSSITVRDGIDDSYVHRV